jgi:putative cell surface antigen
MENLKLFKTDREEDHYAENGYPNPYVGFVEEEELAYYNDNDSLIEITAVPYGPLLLKRFTSANDTEGVIELISGGTHLLDMKKDYPYGLTFDVQPEMGKRYSWLIGYNLNQYKGKKIYDGLFKGVQQERLPLSNTIEEIGNKAFYENGTIEEINLPFRVKKIGDEAFGKCTELTRVKLDSITPPIIGNNIFKDCNKLVVITVPKESVEEYRTTPNWSQYIQKIQPSD